MTLGRHAHLGAHLNIAANHAETGDARAANAGVRQMLRHLVSQERPWWLLRRALTGCWRQLR